MPTALKDGDFDHHFDADGAFQIWERGKLRWIGITRGGGTFSARGVLVAGCLRRGTLETRRLKDDDEDGAGVRIKPKMQ